jgi:hypothetical protein
MKDYSALSDFEINKAVADYLGYQGRTKKQTPNHSSVLISDGMGGFLRNYCNNPEHGWPIIIENLISIEPDYEFIDESEEEIHATGLWISERSGNHAFLQYVHESPLRAAMTVFLMMKDAE